MKIAVIGAGAIGSLVAGYLKDKGKNISVIGRSNCLSEIKQNGISISGIRGNFNIKIDAADKLSEPVDLAILAVKTQDVAEAIKDNLDFLKDSLILTTQNGVQADSIVAKYIPKENIISSIVMFGSTYLQPAKVVHNFEGKWIIGKAFGANDDLVQAICYILNEAFPAIITDNIRAMKYLKVFINANNCIAAILGMSMQEAFSDVDVAKISIGIWKEGLKLIDKAEIKLKSLPDFSVERIRKMTAMPTDEAAKVFAGIMANLSKEPLYGSILQSIKRKRLSEIDYINGEFINIAKENNSSVSLNKKLVEMVHEVEKTNKFFSKADLINQTQGLIN